MHLWMVECLKLFMGHYALDLDLIYRKKLCQEHISYIIQGRNPKFGVWMQFRMAECHIPFMGHFDLDL